jgi:hypothetical protein
MLGIEFATPVGKAASEAIKRVAADGNAECTVRHRPLPVPRFAACAQACCLCLLRARMTWPWVGRRTRWGLA